MERKYLGRLGIVLVVVKLTLSAQDCFLAADGKVPPFGEINLTPRLPNQTQAIITSYKFGCCGNITSWQTYVEPVGGDYQKSYDIKFQVWRPSPTVKETGCYSLVGENRYTSISLGDGGLVSETPGPFNILTVQPGDVVGYFTLSRSGKSNMNGEGIPLDTSRSVDSVWYHTNTESKPLLIGAPDCPFPVGIETERNLKSFTNAAPVLSVRVSPFLCPTATTSLLSSSISFPISFASSYSPTTNAATTSDSEDSVVLKTAVIASVAAVGGSAILLTLMCTLVLAITLAKVQHKRRRTLAEKCCKETEQQVKTFTEMQTNDAYIMSKSHCIDECYSTITTESQLNEPVNTENEDNEYEDMQPVEPYYY